ncbi:type II toxin-antitoxin system Phd/YefM family antitoxin [Psychromicrobium lacuslunae]|nr:type II toxin-antitoxin system Phd/YefM family antitoxin [Psychromicrobium lacuslunae]
MSTLSLAEARASFSRLVDSAASTHERFEITRNGNRAAVLLGADDYDSLLETVAILSDADAVAAVRKGIAEFNSDQTFSADEVREELIRSGRIKA